MNLPTIKFQTLILAATLIPVAAYAQNPMTTDSPYQIRYISNLSAADSVINITNTGASGANLGSGSAATIAGSICANVYAFAADEEIVSCCSCPVTPNGVVSLSAQSSILGNALSGRLASTTLAVALVSTLPVGGSCASSAATKGTLAPGMLAWLHAEAPSTATTCNGGTETSFAPATLIANEYTRLTSLCSFIQVQGSGYGICSSCQVQALGATASIQ